MSWANPNEYIEAIQYPKQAFSDAELRQAKVVTNRFGLPRPISGNFATVFEVETARGRSAVRCFLREVTNQQERYAAIAAHLRQHPLPFMVDFEYQPEGIRVRGRWYPILKMDWADGTRLDTYIEHHLNAPQKLRALAERWIAVCQTLQGAQIAHGDLQHGNVLVTGEDAIRLLDYDDMIVPDVVGLTSREIGHRHYQHPSRKDEFEITLDNFTRVDNFSSHVIGLSLLALSLDPSLWGKTKAGDENLLFRDADYAAPKTSTVFQLLREHANPQVRQLGEMMLRAVSAESLLDVEPLAQNPLESPLSRGKSWLFSQMLERIAPPEAPLTPALPGDSWVFDHLEREQPDKVTFTGEFLQRERAALEAEFARSFLKSARAAFYPYLLYRIIRRFPTYLPVVEKAQQEAAYRRIRDEIEAAKTRRKTLSRLIVEADRSYQQEITALEAEIAQTASELAYIVRKEARERAQVARILSEQEQHSVGQASAAVMPAELPEIEHLAGGAQPAFAPAGWDELVRRRGQLEQRNTNGAAALSDGDLQAARTRYRETRLLLEERRQDAERQLAHLRTNAESRSVVNSLRRELDENEMEIEALRRRQTAANAALMRYERVTRLHLSGQMIRLLLVEALRKAA